MEHALLELRETIARGEATLVLGQDYQPSLVTAILQEAAELGGLNPVPTSLPALHQILGPNALPALIRRWESKSPPLPLLELLSLPWAALLTTSTDPLILQALQGVGSMRSIVELGPSMVTSVDGLRSTRMLHVVRAFGSIAATGQDSAPTSPRELAQARKIRFPALLQDFSRLVGLQGHVVVEGLSERDWLDAAGIEALSLALSQLPPGRIWWFGYVPEAARSILQSHAHFEAQPFQDALQEWASSVPERRVLQEARERVFGVGERAFTIRQAGDQIVARFSAREWRDIGRVASVLDDETMSELVARGTPVSRAEVIGYLRRAHGGIPDWAGPARGLVVEREAVSDLVAAVRDFLVAPKHSILSASSEDHASRASRVPFLLSGPPASGKTMGLILAAWRLRYEFGLSVLWVLRGMSGPEVGGLERVCRLFEERGARWNVLILDSGEPEEYQRIKRSLEAAGRRILILGAESRAGQPLDGSLGRGLRRFPLSITMSGPEPTRVVDFLKVAHIDPGPSSGATRDFVLALSKAIPEIQFGATPALVEEYERVITKTGAHPALSR